MRLTMAALTALVTIGGQPLPAGEMAAAIAMGQRCEAPMLRLVDRRNSFDGYVEKPFARVALVAATARVMHANLDAAGTRRAMRPGYRIWFERKPNVPANVRIERLAVVDMSGRELRPADETNERLFLGTVPSHGIVETFRRRFPESVFDALPASFTVTLGTTHGIERYRVTNLDRAAAIRVCNEVH